MSSSIKLYGNRIGENEAKTTIKLFFRLHAVKKQVQLHFSCTAVSSEDSSATDLLMLQTQYKVVHVCTGTYMHTVYAMGV